MFRALASVRPKCAWYIVKFDRGGSWAISAFGGTFNRCSRGYRMGELPTIIVVELTGGSDTATLAMPTPDERRSVP